MKPLSLLKDEDSSEKNVSSLNGFETCLISHLGIKDAAELVDNSKLKDRDASHIVRAYLMCSSDHKESKNRIHEVAASLGISTHSVSSLKAWISYGERGKRELGELSERELEDIQEYLKGNFTPFEEALLLLELRDLYGVSLAALKEVLISNDATSDNDSCLMKVEGQGEAIKVEEDHVKGIDVEVSDGRGDTVSYDNPLKIMWRQTWIDFLVRRTSEKMRSKMKILTLPGMNCLNIPGYLEAGFRAENIIGVEGSTRSDVRRKFEENAKFLGIRPVIGRLENILPDMKEKLDVVELDFHGQISASKEEIFRQLPLSEFSWVMINLMAKREGKDFQNHMRDFDALAKTADQQFDAYKRMVISELLGDLDASGSGETMLQLMDERGDIVRQQVHVGELRDAGYFDLFAETVGLKRREDWVDQDVFDGFPSQFTLSEWPSWIDRDIFCFEKIALMDHRSSSHLLRKSLMNSSLLEIPLNPRLARAYSQFCFDVAGLYNPLLSSSPLFPAPLKSFDPVIAGLISKMVFHLPTAEPVISDLEKYSYKSTSGKSTCTFFTDMMEIRTPGCIVNEVRSTLRFFLYLARYEAELKVDKIDGLAWNDKYGEHDMFLTPRFPRTRKALAAEIRIRKSILDFRRKKRTRKLRMSDSIQLHHPLDGVRETLQVKKMMEELGDFVDFLRENPAFLWSRRNALRALERQEINVS